MLYKILNNYAPNYLKVLIPTRDQGNVQYGLRNNEDIRVPFARLSMHARSFFPRTIESWNRLPTSTRSSETLPIFKRSIASKEKTNALYFYGQRWPATHHSNLRMGCSDLNYDRCYNRHVIDNPECHCGAPRKTAYHYFMECNLYDNQRTSLRNVTERFTNFTLQAILFGRDEITNDENRTIFDAVHTFIIETERF